MKTLLLILLTSSFFGSCETETETPTIVPSTTTLPEGFEDAYFASGCFWCVEGALEQIKGVSDVISGYGGGTTSNPTYEAHGDHTETVRVIYHPDVVSYAHLLIAFEEINNFDTVGQHPDFGESYRSAIFPKTGIQAQLVSDLLARHPNHKVQLGHYDEVNFTNAEGYHQNYLRRLINGEQVVNSSYGNAYTIPRVNEFRSGTGINLYTPEQFNILFNNATEAPYSDPNLNEDREGVYVSLITGEELFHSEHRFVSDSGWLSFSAVNNPDTFILTPEGTAEEIKEILSLGHLGHIIYDSPEKAPNGRWCINGKAVEFIPNE